MEKKCKYCAMMVPKEAEICPHCRKRLKTSLITKLVVCFILLIFGLPYFTDTSSQKYKDVATAAKEKVDNAPLTEKGKKIKAKHPSWTNEICNTVGNKQVYAGMTTDQAKAAWGKPYKINYTTYGNNREHEQWVMYERGNSYIYFENGILTTIQGSK